MGVSWASSPAARASMRGNRSRDTRPELGVRRACHALGLRYRVCARPVRSVRRTADLVFGPARTAVFVDGCFWHGCPSHFRPPMTNRGYWAAKIAANRARDRQTDRLLAAAGWAVVRVWEHDDPAAAAARIAALVARRRSTAPPAPCG